MLANEDDQPALTTHPDGISEIEGDRKTMISVYHVEVEERRNGGMMSTVDKSGDARSKISEGGDSHVGVSLY